ncbi:glyoxalase [Sungkyunkwania multivorans]|uniref:Glyoxalase n=1 Tax=Sungkyunkwania multivorans TaxID=1173618 RepID=A0ABW3CVZ6_9FLAO
MNDRPNDVLRIRPEIPSARISDNMSADERFQNKTLRPIIKLQNPLLIEVFRNYVNKHKGVFYALSLEKKLIFIENCIQKDIKFRNSLKGMVIGMFTVEEYLFYIENSSSLNKRMMNIVIERLKDQVQLLDRPLLAEVV